MGDCLVIAFSSEDFLDFSRTLRNDTPSKRNAAHLYTFSNGIKLSHPWQSTSTTVHAMPGNDHLTAISSFFPSTNHLKGMPRCLIPNSVSEPPLSIRRQPFNCISHPRVSKIVNRLMSPCFLLFPCWYAPCLRAYPGLTCSYMVSYEEHLQKPRYLSPYSEFSNGYSYILSVG